MDNYIKIDGVIDTKIRISHEEAFKALYEDYYSHSKIIDENDDELIKIFNCLKTLTKYYSIIVGKEKTLLVPCIFNTKKMEFYSTSMDILNTLYSLFNDRNKDLVTSKMIDEIKKSGVYSCFDVSYHGSPDYEYSLVYPGIEAEETYDALNYLYSHFNNYLKKYDDLSDDDKSITRIRRY